MALSAANRQMLSGKCQSLNEMSFVIVLQPMDAVVCVLIINIYVS